MLPAFTTNAYKAKRPHLPPSYPHIRISRSPSSTIDEKYLSARFWSGCGTTTFPTTWVEGQLRQIPYRRPGRSQTRQRRWPSGQEAQRWWPEYKVGGTCVELLWSFESAWEAAVELVELFLHRFPKKFPDFFTSHLTEDRYTTIIGRLVQKRETGSEKAYPGSVGARGGLRGGATAPSP